MSTVINIKNSVLSVLHDAKWRAIGESDIYKWIYEGECILAAHKPEATATNINFRCRSGTTQDLTRTEKKIVRVLSVHYAANADKRKAIYLARRDDISAINPEWEFDQRSGLPSDFIYDEDNPLVFSLYPSPSPGTTISFSASIVPDEYGTITEDTKTTVSPIYHPNLVDWAAHRCFLLDDSLPNAQAKASVYLNRFVQSTGIKLSGEIRTSAFKRD